MRYKDHILRAMNTDVEHLNLEENMLMNRTRCLILISLLVGMFAQAQTSSIKGNTTLRTEHTNCAIKYTE